MVLELKRSGPPPPPPPLFNFGKKLISVWSPFTKTELNIFYRDVFFNDFVTRTGMFLFFDISNENVGWHLRWRVFSSVISSNCELFWLTGILILFFDISNENVCWHLRWRVFSSVISSNCVLYLLTGILILFLDSRSNYVFWHPALIFWFDTAGSEFSTSNFCRSALDYVLGLQK